MQPTTPLLAAGLSDTGRQRQENEDRIHVDPVRGVFIVADGLGGHAAGEKAAETAVEMILTRLSRKVLAGAGAVACVHATRPDPAAPWPDQCHHAIRAPRQADLLQP